MTKNGINLQDSFLNQVRKDNANVTLVLLDGSSLSGHVRGFDNFTVIMTRGQDQHLIYKHAIAHIIHQRPPAREGSHQERPPREERESREPREPREHAQQAAPAGHGGGQPQAPRPQQQNQPRQQAEKPKFNTLDLSDVKID